MYSGIEYACIMSLMMGCLQIVSQVECEIILLHTCSV